MGLFTSRHAFFQVAASRHEDHAKALLEGTSAVVTSDRWWAYRSLPISCRQLCWAHLKRDFAAHAEGLAAERVRRTRPRAHARGIPGVEGLPGHPGPARAGTHHHQPATRIQAHHRPLRREASAQQALSRHGPQPPESLASPMELRHTRRRHTDQQPRRARTTQRRHLRKLSLGTQSEQGERRIERLLSAHTNCRLQHRSLFGYLTHTLTAHNRGNHHHYWHKPPTKRLRTSPDYQGFFSTRATGAGRADDTPQIEIRL
jgi:transposase